MPGPFDAKQAWDQHGSDSHHRPDPAGAASPISERALATKFRTVRAHTEHLAAALTDEDQCVQSMPDASPAKWHRAHTTWFFEEFVLVPHRAGYERLRPGIPLPVQFVLRDRRARHPRPSRGLLTRPGTAQVNAYRAHVDGAMAQLLPNPAPQLRTLVTLGLQHEQQHQELLVTDMLHAFAQNPLAPAVMPGWREPPGRAARPA